jgi:hypothetical protein
MVERVAEAARKSMALREPTSKWEIHSDDIANALHVLNWPTNEMFLAGMAPLIAPLGRKNALLVCNYIWHSMIKAMLKKER